MDFALKKSARREDGRVAVYVDAELGLYAFDHTLFNDERGDHVLPEVNVLVGLQRRAPGLSKEVAVVLSPWRPHCGFQ